MKIDLSGLGFSAMAVGILTISAWSAAWGAPPGPPGLPTVSTGESTLDIRWPAATDDVAVAGYNVYIDNQYVATVSDLSYQATVDTDVSHSVYVVAFDDAVDDDPRSYSLRSIEVRVPALGGESDPDTTEGSTEPPTTDAASDDSVGPSAPENLSVVRLDASSADIQWQASDSADGMAGYNVYRDNQYLDTVFETAFTDSDLLPGIGYRYYIVAFDQARRFSPRSAEAELPANSAEPEDTSPPPAAPDQQTPSDAEPDTTPPALISTLRTGFVSSSRAALRWDPVTDNRRVAGYNVFRNGEYIGTTSSTSFDDLTPPQGSTVRYTVAAFDDAPNYANQSAPLLVELQDDGQLRSALPAPSALNRLLVANDWAELQWQPVVGASAYRIYRDERLIFEVGDSSNSSELRRYQETNSYLDCNFTRDFERCQESAPEPGARYAYTVTAVDSAGLESEPSTTLIIALNETQRLTAAALTGQYALVFNDDFNGTALDTERWNTRLPWGPDVIINDEQQYFVDINNNPDFAYNPFRFTGSTLSIEGATTPTDLLDASNGQPFLSGAITSRDSFNFKYGYVEGRLRINGDAGMLSSFFLYHQWAALNSPEIDIVEALGAQPDVAYLTYHYRDERYNLEFHSSPTMFVRQDVPLDGDFHTYGVLWEENLVVWFLDGEEIMRLTGPEVSRQPMYITAYLVLGSEWATTPDVTQDIFPAQYEIDYIRVYQRVGSPQQ